MVAIILTDSADGETLPGLQDTHKKGSVPVMC